MDAGQRLRTGRLWGGIHPPLVVAVAPFCCVDDAEIDEFVDACDDSDVDELERGAVLRGISILDTSSALMLVIPLEAPLPALQELRRLDWKFGGGAIAVMWSEGEVGSLWTAEVEASRRQIVSLLAPRSSKDGLSAQITRQTQQQQQRRMRMLLYHVNLRANCRRNGVSTAGGECGNVSCAGWSVSDGCAGPKRRESRLRRAVEASGGSVSALRRSVERLQEGAGACSRGRDGGCCRGKRAVVVEVLKCLPGRLVPPSLRRPLRARPGSSFFTASERGGCLG